MPFGGVCVLFLLLLLPGCVSERLEQVPPEAASDLENEWFYSILINLAPLCCITSHRFKRVLHNLQGERSTLDVCLQNNVRIPRLPETASRQPY